MAEKVGEIYYDVTLETQDLLNKNKAVNNELNKTKANLDSLDAQLKKTAAAAKALFAGLGVLAIIDKADQWGQYASRIRQATKSTEEYTLVQDRMLQSANQTFRSINETRESFIQLSPVLREMGLTLGQSLDAIDAFSGLLVTNAASADKAKGAQDAFSKSLQKGKIDADAWMSIYSTLDSVVDLIATSSGKTGEEIRRMGAEGKLSIDVFVKALVEGNAKVMTQVKEMPTTFRDALQNLDNGFTEFIGKNNEAYGVTATLVKGVALLGENFELLANAGLVAVAAGLARYTLGATASAAATAYKALTAVSAAAAEVRLAEAEVATTTAALAQASAFRGVAVTTAQLTVATNAQQAALLNLAKAQATQVAAQTAASSAVRTGLALLGGPAGIAIAAGLAATAWFSYRDATKAAQSSVVDMKQPLDEVIKKFQELNSLQRQQQLTNLGKQYQEDMTTAKTAVHDFMDGFRAAMGQGGTEAAKFRAAFRQEVSALTSDATMSSDELAQALSDLIDRWSKAMGWTEEHTRAMVHNAAAMVDAQGKARATAGVLRELESAANGSAQAVNATSDALNRIGSEAQTQIDGLKRRIALFGKTGTAAGIYYDLENGALKDLNKTEKEAIRLQADKLAALEKNGKPAGGNPVSRTNGALEYYESLVAENKLAHEKIDAEERKALAENTKRTIDDKANAEIYAKAKVEIVRKFARERARLEEQNTQEIADLNIQLMTDQEAKIAAVRDEAVRRANAAVKLGQQTVEQAERAKTAAIAQAERERAALQERLTQTISDNNIAATVNEVARIDLVRQEAFRRADVQAKTGAITFVQAEADKARAAIEAQNQIREKMLSINPLAALEAEYQQKLAIVQLYEQRIAETSLEGAQFVEQKRAELTYQYQQQRLALAEQEFAAQSRSNALLIDSLNSLASTGASTLTGLLTGTTTATQAMQNLAGVVLNEAVSALMQIGLQQVKNVLIADTLAAAEKAKALANGVAYTASVSAQVAGMTALAAQNAFAATAAIPIVGPVLAPAAAAAAGSAAAALGAPAIATAPVAGARQYGGPTEAGKFYRVNETGVPEVWTGSNGNQYMLGSKAGNVTPVSEVSGQGVQWNVIVNNNAQGTVATANVDQQSKTVEIAINEVARQFAQNEGPVWRGVKTGTNVQSRL